MKYRQLGHTSLKVSVIGLGTMTWGLQNTENEAFEQMDYALSQGVNFFDTAELYAIPPSSGSYGTTESIIGNWFQKHGNRNKVILATKIAGPGLEWIRNGTEITGSSIELALANSLKRLKTDYIDLYQLHWPNRGSYHFGQVWNYDPKFVSEAEKDNFLEVLNTLNLLITQGKVRCIGLSNETAWGLAKWLELAKENNLPRVASIQNEYSLLCRHFEPDLGEFSLHEDISLLAWSPLTRGMISGKYLDGARPDGARLTIETRKEHRSNPQTDAAIKRYIKLASDYDLDVCQMSLAFISSRPFLGSTLIGATSMEQLSTNIDSINIELSKEVINGIAKIRRDYPAPF